jgi:hypothetical protein
MDNSLWKKLQDPTVLKRGWQLARNDYRDNFIEEWYTIDGFAYNLELHVADTINRIQTDSYIPDKLIHIEVPKGSYGFRPGTIIPIRDLSVLYSIITLIAKAPDDALPDSVYSWRLKKKIRSGDSLFHESDILDIPFLKRSTIHSLIDPFDPWYLLWPVFDELSKQALTGPDPYRYMATSDIAAYFENIQLPILRDQLLTFFPDDHKIINLLFEFFESWSVKTSTGRYLHRGIPQGNEVSSFLGNCFLIPLDETFTEMEKNRDIKYYRYMDDVRIFTKKVEDARHVIFTMDRVLKTLHLNVQTAKTKILDERYGEISSELFDSRTNHLRALIEDTNKKKGLNQLTPSERRKVNIALEKIAKAKPTNKTLQVLKGSRKPLTGLSLRSFRMWTNMSIGCSVSVLRIQIIDLHRVSRVSPENILLNNLLRIRYSRF